MTTTISYFDFDASRGLECRLALTLAGIPFTDDRVKRDQWPSLKPTLPYGALPVLTHDGQKLAQSNAILRFIGVTHGLHPADPWQAARHDALMQSVEDLREKIPGGSDMTPEQKQEAREAFAKGWLSTWATTVSGEVSGPFVAGDTLNVVDIKLYTILRAFMSGGFDHIPASHFDGFPKLQALYAAVDAHPAVRGWFAAR